MLGWGIVRKKRERKKEIIALLLLMSFYGVRKKDRMYFINSWKYFCHERDVG